MLTSSPDGVPVLERRNVVVRRFVISLGFFALLGLIFLLTAREGTSDRIIGAGSTFAFPLIQRASAAYQRDKAVDGDWVSGSGGVDYDPVGSTGGIERLRDTEVDFAVSDYPLSSEAIASANLIQFPLVVGSIVPVYNLGTSGTAPLKLRAATLGDIYLGRVTKWNDPAIAASNPGVALPDLAIKVIRRADGSGSTLNWTSYLAAGNPAWAAAHASNTKIDWPTGTGVRGGDAMAKAVKATTGAIGYLEAGQASRAGLAAAWVENARAQFVAATPASVADAVRGVDWSAGRRQAPPASPGAYPIVTAAYVIMKRNNPSAEDNKRVLRFIVFILDSQANDARTLGFLPLPPSTIGTIKQGWVRDLNYRDTSVVKTTAAGTTGGA